MNAQSSRREFLKMAGALTLLGPALPTLPALHACAASTLAGADDAQRQPNIVLIITDDQGYGDFGFTGNDKVHTPNLDRLAADSARFERFYVSPVCAPTRACLITGRYNYRTRVVDTYLGRAMMDPRELTLAEMLRAGGYRTGLFGKWHLGDNYAMRPNDKGFDEAVYHLGGGLMQPSGPPDNHYTDPELMRNGEPFKARGYCTDIFTDEALAFIEKHGANDRGGEQPFFCYLATNAPHTPLEVDERWAAPYRALGLDDDTARLYGMCENIDWNIGRLLARLRELELAENTIVIFLGDNGPQVRERFNAGLRDAKGAVYEGGIRTPCLIHWPGRLAVSTVPTMAAHIDLAPTLLELCGVAAPTGVQFDGRSLVPLLRGDSLATWPDRVYCTQWHRGDVPERYRDCCAIDQRWKMVNGKELYDLHADPGEQRDLGAEHPEELARLRAAYEAWFTDVGRQGFDPPAIRIGNAREPVTRLTRQDWRGADGWSDEDLGWYVVEVEREGLYEIECRFKAPAAGATLHFRLGAAEATAPLAVGQAAARIQVNLPAGPGKIEAWIDENGARRGAAYVDVRRAR